MAWVDPEKQKEYMRQRSLACSILVDSCLDECMDCGNEDPLVLQFDHFADAGRSAEDRRGHSLSTAVRLNTVPDLDSLLAELELGDVRCANCHQKRHKEEALV